MAWEVERGTSGMDDTPFVVAHQRSTEPIENQYGQRVYVTAFAACREGITDFYFHFGGYFMSDHGQWGLVKMRLDKEIAITHQLAESTDHSALGMWNGEGKPYLAKAVGRNTLRIRAAPFNESPIEVEFSLAGFDAAVAEIRKTCHW